MNNFFQHQNAMQTGQGFESENQINRAWHYYPEALSLPDNNEKASEELPPLDFSQFQQDFSYLEQNQKTSDDVFEKRNIETERDFSNFENNIFSKSEAESNSNSGQQKGNKNENFQNFDEKTIKNAKKTSNIENLLSFLQNTRPDEILAKALASNNSAFRNPVASQLISNLLSSKKNTISQKNSVIKQGNSNKTKNEDFYEDL